MLAPQKPGIPCPTCGAFIHVSIEQLLVGQPLACSGCDTVLRMDKSRSASAMKALDALKHAQDEALAKRNSATRGYEMKPVKKQR